MFFFHILFQFLNLFQLVKVIIVICFVGTTSWLAIVVFTKPSCFLFFFLYNKLWDFSSTIFCYSFLNKIFLNLSEAWFSWTFLTSQSSFSCYCVVFKKQPAFWVLLSGSPSFTFISVFFFYLYCPYNSHFGHYSSNFLSVWVCPRRELWLQFGGFIMSRSANPFNLTTYHLHPV